ncbi:MAG: hypothetical protein WD275_08775, partial [Rhodothermales bacterium]
MPFRRYLCAAAILSAALLAQSVSAQARLPFPLDVPLEGVSGYDDGVPPPEEIVGHHIGTRHTEPHQVVDYFRAIAESSDRVVVRT